MKTFEELTHDEIVALDDIGVERFVEIAIAAEGIMPIDPPVPPSLEAEGIVRSVIGYQVGGSLVFANESDALQCAAMSLLEEKYDYAIGYEHKYLAPIARPEVKKVVHFRQEDLSRIKDVLQRNKLKTEEFSRINSVYEKFLSKTSKIRNEIWETVNEHRRKERHLNSARATWRKYLDLADGDATVARRFFEKTYADDQEVILTVLASK
jgi:hypothetical protein